MGRGLLPLLVVAALGLGGCGSSGHQSTSGSASTTAGLTPGPSSAPQPAAGSTDSASSPPSSSSGAGAGAGATSTTSFPTGDQGPQRFRLPSGNIGCFVDATGARCDIAQHDWTGPPKPASCT